MTTAAMPTETPTPEAPAAPAAGGERSSLLPEAPTRTEAKAEPAAPADPAAPEAPPEPYEDPRLEKLFGGKYHKFEDIEKAQKAVVDEMKRLQTERQALEMRLGQFKGPPKDEEGNVRAYQFKPREGSPLGEIDPESPEFAAVQKIAAKYGAPEGLIQELFSEVYEPLIEGGMIGAREVEQSRLIDYYGSPEAAVAGTNQIAAWLEDRLGEEARPFIRRGVTTADTAQLIDMVMKAMDNVPLPKGDKEQPQGVTWDQVQAARNADPDMKKPETQALWRTYNEAEAARRRAAGS